MEVQSLANVLNLQERPTRSATARSANEEMDGQYKVPNRLAPPDGRENGNRVRQSSETIIMIAKYLLRHMLIKKKEEESNRVYVV